MRHRRQKELGRASLLAWLVVCAGCCRPILVSEPWAACSPCTGKFENCGPSGEVAGDDATSGDVASRFTAHCSRLAARVRPRWLQDAPPQSPPARFHPVPTRPVFETRAGADAPVASGRKWLPESTPPELLPDPAEPVQPLEPGESAGGESRTGEFNTASHLREGPRLNRASGLR